MDRTMWRPSARQRAGGALLALLLSASGGNGAWSAPAPSPVALERAAALIDARDFGSAAAVLRGVVSADPSNRRAREMLAFALESSGDLAGERRVRAALASEFPRDPQVVTDYGRVLERSGDARGALGAYRRAQALSTTGSTPALDAAIERTNGRSAPEIGAPVTFLSDPDATLSRFRAGTAVAMGSHARLAVLGSHEAASARRGPATTTADALTLTIADRPGPGAEWSAEAHVHALSSHEGTRRDVAAGGAIAGRGAVGATLEADGRAELEAAWDEAAVAVLRGGRTSGAEAHVYAHALDGRLLLQVGARRRRLSISGAPEAARAFAWQSLGVAGADVVIWRRPADALRGEMLDDRLLAPATTSSFATIAYRRYDVSTRSEPAFGARLGLVPRASVDEGSIAASLVAPGGRAGLGLRAGLGHDAARAARTWRAGGEVAWAPTPTTRLTLGYEGATELANGFAGRSHASWLSLHVDL